MLPLLCGIALAPLGVTVQIRDRSFRCTHGLRGRHTQMCAWHDRMHETALVYALFVAHLQWSLEFLGPSGGRACGGLVRCELRSARADGARPRGKFDTIEWKIKMQDRMVTQRSFVEIAPECKGKV